MHPLCHFYLRTLAISLAAIGGLIGIPLLVLGLLAAGLSSSACSTFVLDELESPNRTLN